MKRGKWVVIKSHASESGGYKESRIAALTHTHTHRRGERSHTTSSSIVDSSVTPPLFRNIREVWFSDIFSLKNLTVNNRRPQAAFYTINSQKTLLTLLTKKMASINPLRNVILTSLSKWYAWDEVLRTKAKSNDLWAYINPSTDGKKLLEKPTKLEVSDFPKHIHNSRQETPTPTK